MPSSCAHLKCGGLQVAAWITRLAHHGRNRACALENLVAGALVGLPFGDQAAQALVEKLLVDDNVVGHVEGEVETGPSGKSTMGEWSGGEKATGKKVAGLESLLATRRRARGPCTHVVARLPFTLLLSITSTTDSHYRAKSLSPNVDG